MVLILFYQWWFPGKCNQEWMDCNHHLTMKQYELHMLYSRFHIYFLYVLVLTTGDFCFSLYCSVAIDNKQASWNCLYKLLCIIHTMYILICSLNVSGWAMCYKNNDWSLWFLTQLGAQSGSLHRRGRIRKWRRGKMLKTFTTRILSKRIGFLSGSTVVFLVLKTYIKVIKLCNYILKGNALLTNLLRKSEFWWSEYYGNTQIQDHEVSIHPGP